MATNNNAPDNDTQVFVGFHTTPALKNALARLAKRDGRSVSKNTERLLLTVEEIKAEMEEPTNDQS